MLKRDGTSVVVNSACTATSGSWFSPYDGATWTAASDVDIDHMVPLKNAWIVSIFSPTPYQQPRGTTIDEDTVWRQCLDYCPARGLCQ